jgi:hypothetical protein
MISNPSEIAIKTENHFIANNCSFLRGSILAITSTGTPLSSIFFLSLSFKIILTSEIRNAVRIYKTIVATVLLINSVVMPLSREITYVVCAFTVIEKMSNTIIVVIRFICCVFECVCYVRPAKPLNVAVFFNKNLTGAFFPGKMKITPSAEI